MDKRLDFLFIAGYARSAVVSTKPGGGEVAGTVDEVKSDEGTKSSAVWDPGTYVIDTDVVTEADQEN